MDERLAVAVSSIPVAIEAAVGIPAFFEKTGRFAEMMASFPPGTISPELYLGKAAEALGPDLGAGALLGLGTFITAYLMIHLVPALLERAARATGNLANAAVSEDSGGHPGGTKLVQDVQEAGVGTTRQIRRAIAKAEQNERKRISENRRRAMRG